MLIFSKKKVEKMSYFIQHQLRRLDHSLSLINPKTNRIVNIVTTRDKIRKLFGYCVADHLEIVGEENMDLQELKQIWQVKPLKHQQLELFQMKRFKT